MAMYEGSPEPTRVLIVDDHRDVAEVLARLLHMAGIVTELAFDARSALTAVPRFDPHVVLVDIGLPDVDGYELGRWLHRANHSPYRIAMSGWAIDGARACAAGFDEQLVKPFDFMEMRAAIGRGRGTLVETSCSRQGGVVVPSTPVTSP